MITIKSIILDQTNWIEITWAKVERITLPQEELEDDMADLRLKIQEVETVIHCESFGDSDEYQELLKERCIEFDVELSDELIEILAEQKSKRHNPTEEELAEIEVQKELKRIQAIKSKAGELIISKYPDYKQLNIIRIGGADLEEMTTYIDGIRTNSNEAESTGIKVEDIVW